jgi:hypothetical protein
MTTLDSGLDPSSDEDDLEAELLPLRRSRRLPVVTAALALAVVAGGAFLGGVEIQKHYGASSATAASPRAAVTAGRARTGATGQLGQFGQFGQFGHRPGATTAAGSGMTTGLVTVIKGSTLYVTDFSGNTVKVTTKGARVSKTVTTTVKALSPGDTVVVRGTQAKDGSYAATAITLGSAALGAS